MDKERALAFAAKAKEKQAIEIDPEESEPSHSLRWRGCFPAADSHRQEKGRQMVLRHQGGTPGNSELRRIGANELDAIAICRGFVEAQHEYAATKHDDANRQPVCPTHHQHAGQTGRPGVEECGWHMGRPGGRGNRQGSGARLHEEGQASTLSRLLLQGAQGTRSGRAARPARLRHRGRHDRRLRPGSRTRRIIRSPA